MIDIADIINDVVNEALTIPEKGAGPVELAMRRRLEDSYKDFKYQDCLVRMCRTLEKRDQVEARREFIQGLGNVIDDFRLYDGLIKKYKDQNNKAPVDILGKNDDQIMLDPVKDLMKIRRIEAFRQFLNGLNRVVNGENAIDSDSRRFALDEEDRKNIRVECVQDGVAVWSTLGFSASQKFAVHLWQNVETIDKVDYGHPEKQCPYCTHEIGMWNNEAKGDAEYTQYWYLYEVPSLKPGADLADGANVKPYNSMKGRGPKLLICQHDSHDDWCDYRDAPISKDGYWAADFDRIGDQYEWNKMDPKTIKKIFFDNFKTVDFVRQQYERQPWESQQRYLTRIEDDEIGYIENEILPNSSPKTGQHTDELKKFDVENDVWRRNIRLTFKHFENGRLKFSLPKTLDADKLEVMDADIASFDGFPRKFFGELTQIIFHNCRITGEYGPVKIRSERFQTWITAPTSYFDLTKFIPKTSKNIDVRIKKDAIKGDSNEDIVITGGHSIGNYSITVERRCEECTLKNISGNIKDLSMFSQARINLEGSNVEKYRYIIDSSFDDSQTEGKFIELHDVWFENILKFKSALVESLVEFDKNIKLNHDQTIRLSEIIASGTDVNFKPRPMLSKNLSGCVKSDRFADLLKDTAVKAGYSQHRIYVDGKPECFIDGRFSMDNLPVSKIQEKHILQFRPVNLLNRLDQSDIVIGRIGDRLSIFMECDECDIEKLAKYIKDNGLALTIPSVETVKTYSGKMPTVQEYEYLRLAIPDMPVYLDHNPSIREFSGSGRIILPTLFDADEVKLKFSNFTGTIDISRRRKYQHIAVEILNSDVKMTSGFNQVLPSMKMINSIVRVQSMLDNGFVSFSDEPYLLRDSTLEFQSNILMRNEYISNIDIKNSILDIKNKSDGIIFHEIGGKKVQIDGLTVKGAETVRFDMNNIADRSITGVSVDDGAKCAVKITDSTSKNDIHILNTQNICYLIDNVRPAVIPDLIASGKKIKSVKIGFKDTAVDLSAIELSHSIFSHTDNVFLLYHDQAIESIEGMDSRILIRKDGRIPSSNKKINDELSKNFDDTVIDDVHYLKAKPEYVVDGKYTSSGAARDKRMPQLNEWLRLIDLTI